MIKLIIDKNIPISEESFEGQNIDFDFLPFDKINSSTIKNADALFIRTTTKVNKELISKSNISFIGSFASGENHISNDLLDDSECFIQTAKGSNSQAVFEYVLSCMLENDFEACSVGIVGHGQVGKKIDSSLSKLGYEVEIYDPYLYDHSEDELNKVLSCEVLSINCSYSKEGKYPSHNLISKEQRPKSKLVINSSRGEVVDYSEIAKSSEIFNDVWVNEPKISSNDIYSFMNHSNAFGTPHIAGYTFSSKERQIDLILEKFNDLFSKSVERKEDKKFIKLSSCLSDKLIKSKSLDFKSIISEVFSTRKIATEFKALLSEYNETGKTFGPEEFEKLRKSKMRQGFDEINIDIPMDKDLLQRVELSGFKNQNKEKFS